MVRLLRLRRSPELMQRGPQVAQQGRVGGAYAHSVVVDRRRVLAHPHRLVHPPEVDVGGGVAAARMEFQRPHETVLGHAQVPPRHQQVRAEVAPQRGGRRVGSHGFPVVRRGQVVEVRHGCHLLRGCRGEAARAGTEAGGEVAVGDDVVRVHRERVAVDSLRSAEAPLAEQIVAVPEERVEVCLAHGRRWLVEHGGIPCCVEDAEHGMRDEEEEEGERQPGEHGGRRASSSSRDCQKPRQLHGRACNCTREDD